MTYEFEAAKLADLPIAELETSDNPAALLVLAHRFTVATRDQQGRRRRFKLHLTRLLFRKEGKQQLLRAQLVRRFGELPAWAIERLAEAEPAALERWSLQLLDAARLEDVFL